MERLALDRFSSPWLRFQHVARYRWVAEWAQNRDVLDAACGTAYGARLFRERGARKITALDLSRDAFEEAKRVDELRGISLARADVSQLPIRSRSVDLYVSFETIEHILEDREAIREAARVLRTDGLFVCSTPNRDLLSPGNTLSDTPLNPFHVREYSIDEFVSLTSQCFEGVQLFAQTSFSRRHHHLLRRAGRISNTLAVRTHQLRNIVSLPWQQEAKHRPVRFDAENYKDGAIPEIVIVVCRTPRRL